jgi:hypothetical protein
LRATLFRTRLTPLLLCLICLVGCPSDDGPVDTTDTVDTDAESDTTADTEPEESSGDTYCTSELVCCDDDGNFVTSVIACGNSCPSGTHADTCSTDARCFDAPSPKPTCIGAEGEMVDAVCEEFETMSRWRCPIGSQESSTDSDAGMDTGM